MCYSVAIRTLGTSGDKYTDMIRSLENQTLKPDGIYVYIAEGFPLPQRVGSEVYICCPKGMVTQRARKYEEIASEFILLCDDDILFEPDSVQKLFDGMIKQRGDAISANVYFNNQWSFKEKVIQALFHGIYPSLSNRFAFQVRKSAYFSYCISPRKVMETQCFAGACILLKKSTFKAVSLQDEVWMDMTGYPLGEDLLFAYKLYRYGFRVLVHSCCGIVHQDAQSSHESDKRQDYLKSGIIRYLIWHRAIYSTSRSLVEKIRASFGFYSRWVFRFFLSAISFCLGRNKTSCIDSITALKSAKSFTKSQEYRQIPRWEISRKYE